MEEELPQAVTYISRKDRTWSEQVFLRVHDETGSECVWKSLEARINCHYVNEESQISLRGLTLFGKKNGKINAWVLSEKKKSWW